MLLCRLQDALHVAPFGRRRLDAIDQKAALRLLAVGRDCTVSNIHSPFDG